MNRFLLVITLIVLISCHKTTKTKDTPIEQVNQLTKLHQSKNVFLLHTNLTKTQIEQILNANITADFDDDDGDDDNEPEDDENITTTTTASSPNASIPQTTVIDITEVITNVNETTPIEEVSVNTTTIIQDKKQKHQKKHDKLQTKEQKKEKIHQQNQTVDAAATQTVDPIVDVNVTEVVNGTEVIDTSMQNMTVMIQQQEESKISVMGCVLCLLIFVGFVGLFVFGTQYNKMRKTIIFRNEGLTDYLLFKETQHVTLTEKSITDI